jgi:hypothetical protein
LDGVAHGRGPVFFALVLAAPLAVFFVRRWTQFFGDEIEENDLTPLF